MLKIVITGVSSGIGYAITKTLTKAGFFVYGSVRKQEDADKLTNEIKSNFKPIIIDVTDNKTILESLEIVKSDLKPQESIAALINNAGIALGGPIKLIDTKIFRKQFDVNFFGLIDMTKAFLPLLGAYKNSYSQGKIINISSVSGLRSNPFTAPYCASKFALEAFSDSLRQELMIYGVDVILIEPGPFKSDIWDKTPDPENNEFIGTDYEKSLKKFYKIVIEFGRNGWDPKIIGDKVLEILQNQRPAPRNIITPNKFTNYILSGILPTRIYDKIITNKLHLKKII